MQSRPRRIGFASAAELPRELGALLARAGFNLMELSGDALHIDSNSGNPGWWVVVCEEGVTLAQCRRLVTAAGDDAGSAAWQDSQRETIERPQGDGTELPHSGWNVIAFKGSKIVATFRFFAE